MDTIELDEHEMEQLQRLKNLRIRTRGVKRPSTPSSPESGIMTSDSISGSSSSLSSAPTVLTPLRLPKIPEMTSEEGHLDESGVVIEPMDVDSANFGNKDAADDLPWRGEEISLIRCMKSLPHKPTTKFLEARHSLTISKLDRPIGICTLPSGNIVVGDPGVDAVKIFDPKGKLVRSVRSGNPAGFKRPSDLVALPDGRFAVRDDSGIQLYDCEGAFLQNVCSHNLLGLCFGLATDGKGQMFTLNTNNGSGNARNVTERGQTDVIVIDVESLEIKQRIQLCDIIRNSNDSKCRFLHCRGKKLYIVDLGLDCVYTLDLKAHLSKTFGCEGRGKGQFRDPAGLAADKEGTMIVADSRNHRVQIFDSARNCLGSLKFDRKITRPSGILLDHDEDGVPVIYVLSLWNHSVTKFLVRVP